MPVLIRDVAKVQFGFAPRYGAQTRNGEGEVVGGIVMMLKGENSGDVVARVKDRMEIIQKALPEGVVIDAYLDRTSLVNRAIATVEKPSGRSINCFIYSCFISWECESRTYSCLRYSAGNVIRRCPDAIIRSEWKFNESWSN